MTKCNIIKPGEAVKLKPFKKELVCTSRDNENYVFMYIDSFGTIKYIDILVSTVVSLMERRKLVNTK